jgi:1,2-diacylglycerol-3-alpha-glucose alpha-1,2-glucosyltransferase
LFNSRRLAKKARKHGKKVVYHAHSTEEDFRNSFVFSNVLAKPFKKLICSSYSLGDCVITPTEYSKRLLLGYGINKPVYAVSNGVDLTFYEPRENERAEFRAAYGLSETQKVVISVGLYFERKGLLDFTELAARMPDYNFIWFGKTPLYSIPAKIRKAVKTKLPNLLFAGYVRPEELKKAYAGTDLFLFPTYEETEGIVLLEALACKTDTLVRDIPAFGWLRDDVDCYKAKDINEMERKIRDIVEKRLPDISENGFKAVADKDIPLIGEYLADIYSGLLHKPT